MATRAFKNEMFSICHKQLPCQINEMHYKECKIVLNDNEYIDFFNNITLEVITFSLRNYVSLDVANLLKGAYYNENVLKEKYKEYSSASNKVVVIYLENNDFIILDDKCLDEVAVRNFVSTQLKKKLNYQRGCHLPVACMFLENIRKTCRFLIQ